MQERMYPYISGAPERYEAVNIYGAVVTTSFEEKTPRGKWALRGEIFQLNIFQSPQRAHEYADKVVKREESTHSDPEKFRNFRSSSEFAQVFTNDPNSDSGDIVFVEIE